MKHAGKMTLDVLTISGKTSRRPSKEKSEDSSPNHVALLPLFAISAAATPTANQEDVHRLFQNLKYNSIKPGSIGFHAKKTAKLLIVMKPKIRSLLHQHTSTPRK